MIHQSFVHPDNPALLQMAEVLKVMAHPVRLCIIRGLMDRSGCTVSQMQDCLGIPQSSLSTHLQKLRSVGIVRPTRKGLEVAYEVIHPMAIQIAVNWVPVPPSVQDCSE